MTEDELIGWLWLSGEVIVLICIVLDYCIFSDSRSKYEQDDIYTWYGLIIMAWPVMFFGIITLLVGVIFGQIGRFLLRFIKFIFKKLFRLK